MEQWNKIAETEKREYYICNDGRVISMTKVHHIERQMTSYMKNGNLVVKIGKKEIPLKKLLAQSFIKEYKDSDCILFKDGNASNVSLDNLVIIPRSLVSKVTGAMSKSQKIIVTDTKGTQTEYQSIRKSAIALNCSNQTLLDYMNGKVRNSVLQGITIIKTS